MARLPDLRELGALPSALSGRSLASYDVSGYARGAAAIAEGLGVLGKGFGRAADAIEDARQREGRIRLDRAKADAAYLVATKQLRASLANEADPDAVTRSYPEAFRNAYAGAADLIADPEAREVWGLARNADRDGQIAASLDHANALRRGRDLDGVRAQLETLRMTALDSDDETTRTELMRAGQGLIAGLQDTGLLDEEAAKATREHWATSYARDRLGRMTPDERLKALEQSEGTVAELVPAEARADLVRTTRVELAETARKVASDGALTRYLTDKDIADDLARIEATGRGNDDLTAQRIDEALGPETRRAWQARRDDAFAIWQATHDLATLTDAEISARVEALAPQGAGATRPSENMNKSRMAIAALVQFKDDTLSPAEKDRICSMDPVAEGAKFGNMMLQLPGKRDPFTGRMVTREWAIEQGYKMEQSIREIQAGLCGPRGIPS